MSGPESKEVKTAATCTNYGGTYVVHVSPNGSVDPLGVTECSCGESDLIAIDRDP